jgi:uncharacterized delta-60 repeat protein
VKHKGLLLIAVLALAMGGGVGSAAHLDTAGSLDSSFDFDGTATVPGTDVAGAGAAVVQDNQSRIIAVGGSVGSTGNGFLARFCPDGSLDDGSQTDFCGPGFGSDGNGVITLPPSSGLTAFGLNAVAVDNGNRVIAVGSATNADGDQEFLVARFCQNGHLDDGSQCGGSGFGTHAGGAFDHGGITVLKLSSIHHDDVATAVAPNLKGNGSIVVAGYAGDDGSHTGTSFAVARFNQDGSLDTSNFNHAGTPGYIVQPIGTSPAYARAVALSPQNGGSPAKIVVAGSAVFSGTADMAVAQFKDDGTLDTSFGAGGTHGYVKQVVGSSASEALALALQGQRILLAGDSSNGSNHDFALVRLKPTGAIDKSFNATGVETIDFGGEEYARGVGVEPDGKIVAAGDSQSGAQAALARVGANGSLDATFGTGGKVESDIGDGSFTGSGGLAVQGDGNILVFGTGTSDNVFTLGRFLGAATNPASIWLGQQFVPPGQPLQIGGQGFDPYQLVDVYFDVSHQAIVHTDGFGSFQTALTVPSSALPGVHWVTAVDRSTGNTAAQQSVQVSSDWLNFRNVDGSNPFENALSPSNAARLRATTFNPLNGGSHNGVVDTNAVAHEGNVYLAGRDGQLFQLDQTGNPYNQQLPPNSNWGVGSYLFQDSSPGLVSYCQGCPNGGDFPGVAIGGCLAAGNACASPGSGRLFLFGGPYYVQCTSAAVGQIHSSPVSRFLSNGGPPEIVVGSNDGKLYAFDGNDCHTVWSTSPAVTGGIRSSPVCPDDGSCFFGGGDGVVYAVNNSDGTPVWSSKAIAKASYVSSPAYADGSVYIGGQDKIVRAFDEAPSCAAPPCTGVAPLWSSVPLAGAVKSSPAVSGGLVYVGAGKNLYALNSDTGAIVWTAPIGTVAAPVDGSPAVANGLVAVTTAAGKLYVVDAATGRRYYSAVIGPLGGSPIIVNGMVIVATQRGVYYFTAPAPAPRPTKPNPATLRP